MDDAPPASQPLAEVGRYERLSLARERGLVVSAMELPHWIVRDGREFTLRVEEADRERVAAELEKYEAERQQRAPAATAETAPAKFESTSLYVAAWILSAFWMAQSVWDQTVDFGEASTVKIFHGEWWRVFTALTLHADVSHLLANLASGLMFAAFLLRHLRAGVAWLAIVLSGAMGNVLNAWFYAPSPHISIGSSTAVFGALGLLVGCEFISRLRHPHTRGRWQLILPIGAGLALLAYLGVGDEQKHTTDYMAHFWGFVSGITMGLVLAASKIDDRLGSFAQTLAGIAAPASLVAAWWLALRGK